MRIRRIRTINFGSPPALTGNSTSVMHFDFDHFSPIAASASHIHLAGHITHLEQVIARMTCIIAALVLIATATISLTRVLAVLGIVVCAGIAGG